MRHDAVGDRAVQLILNYCMLSEGGDGMQEMIRQYGGVILAVTGAVILLTVFGTVLTGFFGELILSHVNGFLTAGGALG